MECLRLRDLYAATRFLRGLHELDELASFQRRLLAQLPTVVPCDMVIYCENNLRTKESRGFANLPGAFFMERTPASTDGMFMSPRCSGPTAEAGDRR